MSRTPHFGSFEDSEVLTLEAFADRLSTTRKTAGRILERLDVPVQSPAQDINLIAMHQFRMAIQKGGFERWNRENHEEE